MQSIWILNLFSAFRCIGASSTPGVPRVKSAFYVTSDAVARLVKIHVLMTDHSPLECAMFETLEETAKWLGVSTETLEMGAVV